MIIAIGDSIIVKAHSVLIKNTSMIVTEIKTCLLGNDIEEQTIKLEWIEKDSVVFRIYNKTELERMIFDKESFDYIKDRGRK